MANEVTTGRDLNSYTGNANLAGDLSQAGYAKPDLTPLQTLAINRYQTNLLDREQQIKDRDALEAQYIDPKVYVDLEQGYSDQLKKKMDRFKDLGKKQLELNPNSDEYHEFKNLHAELVADNARLKAVQTVKEQYQKNYGESQNVHEKERIDAYIKQLDAFKIGDTIPIYNKTFLPDMSHLPSNNTESGNYEETPTPGTSTATTVKTGSEKTPGGTTSTVTKHANPAKGVLTGTYERVNPVTKNIETVKNSINNARGLDKIADRQFLLNPEVATTGADFAHSLLTHGGIDDLNAKAKQYAQLSLGLNEQLIKDKYAPELEAFKKAYPNGSYKDFMEAIGLAGEYQDNIDGHKYLTSGVRSQGIEVVPAKPGEKLMGYTYSDDGLTRLSVDDNTLRAIIGATMQPIGKNEQVIGSKVSLLPYQIAEEQAKTKRDNALTNAKVKTEKAKQNKLNKQTNSIPELTESQVPRIGEHAKLMEITEEGTGKKSLQYIVKAGDVPKVYRDLLNPEGSLQKPVMPPKPKEGDFKDKNNPARAYAKAIKEYNDEVEATNNKARGEADATTYRMVFLNPDGSEDMQFTDVKNRDVPIQEMIKLAINSGVKIEFHDSKHNIRSNTNSIDKQTLIDDLKARTGKDPALTTELEADN